MPLADAPQETFAPVCVIAAHPHWRDSRVNRRLCRAAQDLPGVDVVDLYGRYPDHHIDVATEQRRLSAARLIVWQHPLQWYSMPALMKLWVDEVLAHGWAYGRTGTALRGKDLWLVVSTGGTEAAYHPQGYNRHFFDAFLPAYEQTAALCGLRFLPPLILHGAHAISEPDLEAHAAVYRERLSSHPDWPEIEDLACPGCDVPSEDRPGTPEVSA